MAIRLRCGDMVVDKDDPRHVGRLERVVTSYYATVKWENGWISEVPLENLERLDRYERKNPR